ncbi:MAG: hypothetical protein HZA10_07080 [Nitrospirae bacterium]|nr:hypothetical protein [Nitrospirota bacterium]
MRDSNNFREMANIAGYPKVSPPLTGGDEGEGGNSILITPTLALPRQGGGKYKETPRSRRLSELGIENLINFCILKFLREFMSASEKVWGLIS